MRVILKGKGPLIEGPWEFQVSCCGHKRQVELQNCLSDTLTQPPISPSSMPLAISPFIPFFQSGISSCFLQSSFSFPVFGALVVILVDLLLLNESSKSASVVVYKQQKMSRLPSCQLMLTFSCFLRAGCS